MVEVMTSGIGLAGHQRQLIVRTDPRRECTPAEGRSTCTVVLAVTHSWQPLGDAMWEVKGRAETLILGHNAAWAREGVTLARAARR